MPAFSGFLFFFLFFFPSLCPAKKSQVPQQKASLEEEARQDLKNLLEKDYAQMTKIKISQEIFLSPLQIQMKSSGFLSLHGKKFLLRLKGLPSLFILFDGEFLWYQADEKEKVVFKLKKTSPNQILSHFFDKDRLFKHFQIEELGKIKSGYILKLAPKKEIENLEFIFVKWTHYISEIRMTWRDSNSWQKYTLSKAEPHSFPDDYFQFDDLNFQVIAKEDLFITQ